MWFGEIGYIERHFQEIASTERSLHFAPLQPANL
jgi:hypothetical protein